MHEGGFWPEFVGVIGGVLLGFDYDETPTSFFCATLGECEHEHFAASDQGTWASLHMYNRLGGNAIKQSS